MKTYLCIVCGFIYDEASGRPEEKDLGIYRSEV